MGKCLLFFLCKEARHLASKTSALFERKSSYSLTSTRYLRDNIDTLQSNFNEVYSCVFADE